MRIFDHFSASLRQSGTALQQAGTSLRRSGTVLRRFDSPLGHYSGCLVDRVALTNGWPFAGGSAQAHPLDRAGTADRSPTPHPMRTAAL
ncbi:hypothetical protein SGFS_031320 [Streptomyces graminofaciens]|jgi:hypothetical protein|uniref:Uncharacterized protein n=1 Tax=Streptomyces graminofaciens TaxID=68212 RepID=A0ABM7F5K5_9ACTN|nr:hypothetical protein [Streptomyces graminofaciens]BBC31838.1 hypothetical protein SGFS_031320 [Streptomyces graminofaciens]